MNSGPAISNPKSCVRVQVLLDEVAKEVNGSKLLYQAEEKSCILKSPFENYSPEASSSSNSTNSKSLLKRPLEISEYSNF